MYYNNNNENNIIYIYIYIVGNHWNKKQMKKNKFKYLTIIQMKMSRYS